MQPLIKVGLIGAGYWGNILMKNLPDSLFNLLWVCDTVPFTHNFNDSYKTTGDYKKILDDPEVEAVLIATPPATHYQIAKEALEAGKHVWSEKPLTLKSDEAWNLHHLAKKLKKVAMVDLTFLFSSEIEELRQILRFGHYGKPLLFESIRANYGPFKQDTNILFDLLPHDLSILLTLFGFPEYVSAVGSSNVNPGITDEAFIKFDYKSPYPFSANIRLSWLETSKVRKLKLITNIGSWENSDNISKFIFNDKKRTHHESVREPSQSLRFALSHFAACIRNSQYCIPDFGTGAHIVWLIEKTQESLDSRREVSLR